MNSAIGACDDTHNVKGLHPSDVPLVRFNQEPSSTGMCRRGQADIGIIKVHPRILRV